MVLFRVVLKWWKMGYIFSKSMDWFCILKIIKCLWKRLAKVCINGELLGVVYINKGRYVRGISMIKMLVFFN